MAKNQEEQLFEIFENYSRMNNAVTDKIFELFTFTKQEADTLVNNYTYTPKIDKFHIGISVNFLKDDTIHVPLVFGNLSVFKELVYSTEKAHLIKTVIESGHYVYVPDTLDSNVLNLKKYADNNIRSAFFAPMFYDHKCVGVLTAVANEPHLFEGCCAVMYSFAQLLAQIYPEKFL
jgi:hypothetical protein